MDKVKEGLNKAGSAVTDAAKSVADAVSSGISKLKEAQGPVRVAIVGCGDISRSHLEAIIRCAGRAQITVLCDPSPENRENLFTRVRSETTWDAPLQFASLEGALEADSSVFDAVFILTPSETHEQYALLALAAKKHVFIETPLSLTVESAQRIVDSASSAGVVAAVGEHSQFWHEVLVVKQIIDSGELGKVLTARANMWVTKHGGGGFAGNTMPGAAREDKTEAKRAGGGFMYDCGLHWIRPLRIWMGNVESVIATCGMSVKDVPCSMGHAILRMKTGLFASFDAILSEAPLSHQPFFDIQCEKGEIIVDGSLDGGFGVKVYSTAHPGGALATEGPQGWTTAYNKEVADFVDRCVPLPLPDTTSAELALTDLKIITAMKTSALTGEWVDI